MRRAIRARIEVFRLLAMSRRESEYDARHVSRRASRLATSGASRPAIDEGEMQWASPIHPEPGFEVDPSVTRILLRRHGQLPPLAEARPAVGAAAPRRFEGLVTAWDALFPPRAPVPSAPLGDNGNGNCNDDDAVRYFDDGRVVVEPPADEAPSGSDAGDDAPPCPCPAWEVKKNPWFPENSGS